MYSPLPDDGPVCKSRLATPLRGIVRLFNALLAVLGLSLMGGALYMFIVYHRTGLTPPAASPEPAPPPESLLPGVSLQTLRGFGPFEVDLHAAASGAPWFIYAVAGAGAYMLVASSAGMAGAKANNRHRLFIHILLLVGLVLMEVAVLLLVFTDSKWKHRLPVDPSGFWDSTLEFIAANAHVVKVVCMALIVTELVALGAACWLHGIYQAAYDDWLDGVEERQAQTRQLLARTVERTYAGQGAAGSAWKLRIKDKYNVGSADVEEAARAVRQAAALADNAAATARA